MPLGIERINARKRQPNERIVFIKPIEGPDKALAQDFLERLAAICSPIMKANHLAVMSLEEHEPNLEFVGRNFNAGEIVQLVLKAPYTGQWLPFRHVQMVLMHELAHCKEMNHSGAFWKVRNQYAGELRSLWARNYSGDGFWSRGQTLLSGQYTTDLMPQAEAIPHSICGGTFRSTRRGKKRRRRGTKEQTSSGLSYAERKQRRIAKKFGTQGQALGMESLGDEKIKVEDKKIPSKPQPKPRVAKSARGRDLRAQAALARFEKRTESQEPTVKEEDSTESDSDDTGDSKDDRIIVRVCEGEDEANEENAQREMDELRDLPQRQVLPDKNEGVEINDQEEEKPIVENSKSTFEKKEQDITPQIDGQCAACSMVNDPNSVTCMACANVLDRTKDLNNWQCQRKTCRDSVYRNSGDCGRCGLCGEPRGSKAS